MSAIISPKQLDNRWEQLTFDVINYDWKYRRKICTKCPLEYQKEHCFKSSEFRYIDGMLVQKTYCKKQKLARANKFRSSIKSIMRLSLATMTDKIYKKKNQLRKVS